MGIQKKIQETSPKDPHGETNKHRNEKLKSTRELMISFARQMRKKRKKKQDTRNK